MWTREGLTSQKTVGKADIPLGLRKTRTKDSDAAGLISVSPITCCLWVLASFFFFSSADSLSCASCETWLLSAWVSHFTTLQRSSLSLSHLRRILRKGSGPASARCPALGKPTSAKGQEGFAGGASGKEPACQCRRHKRHSFDSWVGKIPWRRTWQPTPLLLPWESHGQRSLMGYSPYSCKELHMTEAT